MSCAKGPAYGSLSRSSHSTRSHGRCPRWNVLRHRPTLLQTAGGVSPSSLSRQDHSIQLLLSATGKDVDVRLALGVGDHMTWNSPAYEIAPAPSDTVPTRRPFRSCAAGLEAQVGVRFRELTSRSVTVSDIECAPPRRARRQSSFEPLPSSAAPRPRNRGGGG
jgi:hypothetical protein